MNEQLVKIIDENKDMLSLFLSLYVDMQFERAFRDLDLDKKHLDAHVRVPTKDQIFWIQKVLKEKEIVFSTEEIVSFTVQWGRSKFNWLIKDS